MPAMFYPVNGIRVIAIAGMARSYDRRKSSSTGQAS